MKILQVSHGYYPAIGGIEEHVRNISERLARKHEVVVFTGGYHGGIPKEEEINGVLVRRFRSFAPNNAYHLSLDIARELRRHEFDIVHGHNYHALLLYFCRYAKARKFVVTTHYHGHGHTWLRDLLIRLYKPFGKRILDDASKIIAVSNYEKELLMRDFGIEESKIKFIPNGINYAEFQGLGKANKNPKTILYVGRLEDYKGVQYIIRTLPLLNSDFCLQIVGTGVHKEKLVKLVDKLGLSSRVSFCQGLSREELIQRYARAGVFVLLSQYEASSLVVAEALAARVPCVVANTLALKEWVNGKDCFGIDYPIDSNQLADLIKQASEAKVTATKIWDWDEVAEQISRLYQE